MGVQWKRVGEVGGRGGGEGRKFLRGGRFKCYFLKGLFLH